MRTKHTLLVSLLAVVGLLVSSGSQADAQRRVKPAAAKPVKAAAKAKAKTARAARPAAKQIAKLQPKKTEPHVKSHDTFKAALKSSESKFFTRDVNGSKRLIANISGQSALNSISQAMGRNSDVIQIVHIGKAGIQHTMAIFDGELVHTQYAGGTGNWRLRSWGDMLRASDTKMYSAFISLSGPEAANLRNNIAQGRRDQGPENMAGPNWVNGKLKQTSMGGCRSFNCASVWSAMPLGQNGETLGQIAGIGNSYSGNPRQLQKAFETGGNARIIGVAVYGPKLQNFGANPAAPVVEL
tara:strand:- start:17713 stop:18603 length:891 start_codon:yes stop_codon:yes gene_type:complete